MTQRRIFDILTELNDLNNSNTTKFVFNEYSNLRNNEIKSISSVLTEIVYSTNKESNLTSNLKRNQLIINFIKNLIQTSENHFKLTKENQKLIFKKILNQFESNLDGNDKNEDVLKKFYSEKDEKTLTNNQKLEFISKRDQETLRSDDFDILSQNLIQNNQKCYEEIFSELTQKNYNKSNLKSSFINSNNNNIESDFFDLIKLIYAWFNLNNNHKELKQVLKILKSYIEKLQPINGKIKKDFLNLIWYIWDHLSAQNQEDDLKLVLEEFPFILEKELINFCKKIMQSENIEIGIQDFLESDVNLTRLLTENNFKRIALDILYELFTISGYNCKILKFIDVYNKNF